MALWGRTEEGFATDPIMVENNLIFVATRIQIQMDTYPKWCALCLVLPNTLTVSVHCNAMSCNGSKAGSAAESARVA